MLALQSTEPPASVVMALFADKAVSFSLSNGATFADLADSLSWISHRKAESARAVFMTLGTTGRAVSSLMSGI